MAFGFTRPALPSRDDTIVTAKEVSQDESVRRKPMCHFNLAMFIADYRGGVSCLITTQLRIIELSNNVV